MATKQQQDGGFTLIEVLIVIVILGVLATVVVFAVGGATTDAEDSGCRSDAKVLVTAVEAYFAQHGSGPIPDADGTPDGYENDSWLPRSSCGHRRSSTTSMRTANSCR